MNARFHARLNELGIAHDYHEITGGHDWPTVLRALPHVLGTMAAVLTAPD